jgi:cardiolipin synthase
MVNILSEFWQLMPNLVTSLYFLTVVFIAVLIVLENRNPVKTISWVLVLVLIPFAGIILYLFLGQEYRKQKMFSRKRLKDLVRLRRLTMRQLDSFSGDHPQLSKVVQAKKHLIKLLLTNSHALATNDNEVTVLKNGDETFPAIFEAMENARHHIHLEYYIVEDDELGNQLRETLIRKAKEGIEVRFIYDDVGSWALKKRFFRPMLEAGIKVDCFMKVRFPHLTSRVNYRNHRKILIVDGIIGFVGGLNIANRYLYGTPRLGSWRDTHLMIKGGAVTSLQIVFMADWYFVSREILKGEPYFQPLREGNGPLVQIVASGPDSDWESIGQAYFSAIASATEHVYIATPYLMPTGDIITALKTAALGGIDVRILVPGKSDAIIPKWGTDSYIQELLEAGVKVYFYRAGFTHSKVIIVDGIFSSVGTANMDFRSLETNFEVNAMIYDPKTAATLISYFMNDLKQSEQVLLREWKKRPRFRKANESFARLLSPML